MTKEEKKIDSFNNSCIRFETALDNYLRDLANRDFSERSELMTKSQEFSDERRDLYDVLPSDARDRSYDLLKRCEKIMTISGMIERFSKFQDVICGLL